MANPRVTLEGRGQSLLLEGQITRGESEAPRASGGNHRTETKKLQPLIAFGSEHT